MVQIIPRAEEDRPLWMDIVFFFSIGVLVLFAAGFFVLQNAQEKTEQEIADLSDTLAKTQNQEFLATEKKLKALKRTMQDFTDLLQNRKNPLDALTQLESHAHQATFFKTLSVDVKTGEMQLDGIAKTFSAVEEQLAVFRTIEGARSVDLTNLSLSAKGEITYQVIIQ